MAGRSPSHFPLAQTSLSGNVYTASASDGRTTGKRGQERKSCQTNIILQQRLLFMLVMGVERRDIIVRRSIVLQPHCVGCIGLARSSI